jgi:hypothetical protein
MQPQIPQSDIPRWISLETHERYSNSCFMSVDKLLSIHKVAVMICEKSLGQVRTSLPHGGFQEWERLWYRARTGSTRHNRVPLILKDRITWTKQSSRDKTSCRTSVEWDPREDARDAVSLTESTFFSRKFIRTDYRRVLSHSERSWVIPLFRLSSWNVFRLFISSD